MDYILIASLGTGMYKNGYRTTTYRFNDGKEYETSWFLQALLKCQYRDFKKIVLVGTTTSNWDSLVDLNDKNAEQLWEKLATLNNEKKGITADLIRSLEDQLTKQYQMPVKLVIHTDKIDEDTTAEVFNAYQSIVDEIPQDCNVLFDITHGFRSMPILMYQNLQFIYSNNYERKIEFVYGEYIPEQAVAYVRNLSNFWHLAQIKEAIHLFETKLEGTRLAELMKSEWLAGSKAINKLSEVVQTNFSLQFIEVTKQIRNSLNVFPESAPSWLFKVKTILEQLLKLADKSSVSKTLYNYSKYLLNLKLNSQAIITLQIAVETAIVEYYGDVDKDLGNYDWINGEGREYLKKLRNKYYKEIEPLFNLERFRNQVAHGGGKNNQCGYPQASNILTIYKSSERGYNNLMDILIKESKNSD